MHSSIRIGLLAATLLAAATAAQAANISGTISATRTIKENSQLTGPVQCTVTGAPCIKFGVAGITLNLNGFTMTGNGSVNSCTFNASERGIDTNGLSFENILGPGIVTQFQGDASIAVTGNASNVQEVVVLSSCGNGILVQGSNNNIYANTVDLSDLSASTGASLGGICVCTSPFGGGLPSAGSHNIQRNEIAGAASAILVGGSSGIPSNNNQITENNASSVYNNVPGGSRGINIFSGSTGNQILYNQALGNTNFDIVDGNSPGANNYAHNLCSTSTVGSFPSGQNICEVLGIAGHIEP